MLGVHFSNQLQGTTNNFQSGQIMGRLKDVYADFSFMSVLIGLCGARSSAVECRTLSRGSTGLKQLSGRMPESQSREHGHETTQR